MKTAIPRTTNDSSVEAATKPSRPIAARRDDTIAGLCGVWMIAGLFLDGWAHRNQKPETFFSPWHGILYSGFFASALWMLYVIRRSPDPGQVFGSPDSGQIVKSPDSGQIVKSPDSGQIVKGQRLGSSWRTTMPIGYGFRAAGVGVFGVGALADLIWHSVFGIEVDIEALLSPSHLLLLTGGLLMAAGPIISTMAREFEPKPTWSSMGPVVGTVAFITSLMQFFIMYLSPYDSWVFSKDQARSAYDEGGRWMLQTVTIRNVAHILLFTVFMVLPTLWLARNIKLPRGAFLTVWFLPTVLQSLLSSFEAWPRLAGSLAAAILAELMWPKIRTRFHGNVAVAALAGLLAAMSFVTWIGLFATMRASNTLAWQAELWFGVPTFAALLSALIVLSSSSIGSKSSNVG